MQLAGKGIVVVGGGGGIGGGTVRCSMREGANVAVLDINEESARIVAKEASSLGPGRVTYASCDVTDREQVDRCFVDAVADFGGLDAVFNMSGTEYSKQAEDLTGDEMRAQLELHVLGTMYTNQAAFRAMKDHGGSIINFSSLAGVMGFPLQGAYSTAKGAILAWTRTCSQEWGKYRIRVNAVVPSIKSPLLDYFLNESLPPEAAQALRDSFARNIPIGGYPGDPDTDWGPVGTFLASDGSRFVTGQTLSVDGGWVQPR